MKTILIVCSTKFYNKIESISKRLDEMGYKIIYPNGYLEDDFNDDYSLMSDSEYKLFYKKMYRQSRDKISNIDELLILNFDKEKNEKIISNYIGASTFLEMYEAYMQNKKIFIYNELPDTDNLLYDDILGMDPIILHGNIDNIVK